MEKKDSVVLRNIDGEHKWDKLVVAANAKDIDAYYRSLPDKRVFDLARVVLIETTEEYILVKNNWKYDEQDMKKCRNLKGVKFMVEDIEFIKISSRDYISKRMLNEDDIPANIIIKDLDKKKIIISDNL